MTSSDRAVNKPSPGHPKTISTKKLPVRANAKLRPITDSVGPIAFFSA